MGAEAVAIRSPVSGSEPIHTWTSWLVRASWISGVSGVVPAARSLLEYWTEPEVSRNCSSSLVFSSKRCTAFWALVQYWLRV